MALRSVFNPTVAAPSGADVTMPVGAARNGFYPPGPPCVVYLLYADGSGNTGINRRRRDNGLYVLSGVIIHEDCLGAAERMVEEAKKELFPGAEPPELHAHDIWNGAGPFADGRLGVNLAKKREIFSRAADLVCVPGVTLISAVVDKDRMADLYGAPDPTEYSWTLVMERFEHFLKSRPGEDRGRIIMDSSREGSESEIRGTVSRLARRGSRSQRIEHVMEDVTFVQSHRQNMIQLADMAAYVVHRSYADPSFRELFERMRPGMYQPAGSPEGYGVKEFPPPSADKSCY